jgi:SWI/SNF-related matrix-associated actin-dependent regulator 1 of chromatin subfamily A
MSNDELPLSAEVASAYLDGELDATERAAASADPDVMADVESFTRVRAALGEIDPVVASTKTAAIAAALAEFDAIHAAAEVAATNVVSLQSRRMRSYRVLSGVAAVLVVGAVVVTALNASGGDEKDSASSATEIPAASPAELPSIKIAGPTEAATAATDAPAATAAPAATVAGSSDRGVAADSGAAAVPVIDTTEALKEFAASVESASTTTVSSEPLDAEAPPPYGNPAPAAGGYAPAACIRSDQVVLGSILFQGSPAFAVRDTASGALQAVDAADCRVLIEVEGP